MRFLVGFLLGLIVGAGIILFLPESRRVELDSQLRPQMDALEKQVRQLGDQLKNVQLPKPNESPAPSATTTPASR